MTKNAIPCTVAMLAATTALWAAAPARADFGIGINVSNLGIGVEARKKLSPSFDLRFGIAGLAYETSFKYDHIEYDVEQSTSMPEVKLDWRPMQGMFRFTIGAGYYNQVSDLTLVPDLGRSYTIGNTSYTSAQIRSLHGKISYHVGAPYFGVGWDFLRDNKRLGFTIDAGAYYRNDPKVLLTSTGSVSANDLAIETQNIKDDSLSFVPTVKLGLLFRF